MMTTTVNINNAIFPLVSFAEINIGDYFIDGEGNLCIRIDCLSDDSKCIRNAIMLNGANPLFFLSNDQVKKVIAIDIKYKT